MKDKELRRSLKAVGIIKEEYLSFGADYINSVPFHEKITTLINDIADIKREIKAIKDYLNIKIVPQPNLVAKKIEEPKDKK